MPHPSVIHLRSMPPRGEPRWNLRPLPYNGLPWEGHVHGPPLDLMGIIRGGVGQPDQLGLRVDPGVGTKWGLYAKGPLPVEDPRVSLQLDPSPMVLVHLDVGVGPLDEYRRTLQVSWEWAPEHPEGWETTSAMIIRGDGKGSKQRNPLPCYKSVARKRR